MLGYSFREIQKFTYRFLGEVENPKARQNRTDMYNRKPQPEELEDEKKIINLNPIMEEKTLYSALPYIRSSTCTF